MNLLIDVIPTTVNIDGVDYEINSDFRTSILFELLMLDDDISDEEKAIQALELYYYPTCPHNIKEAFNKLIWFYKCGKDNPQIKGTSNAKSNKQIYSFEYDDDYIYSAYLDQYCIDLQDIEYLHWWKFKAMFKALKEDNMIVKIMSYRNMDLSSITDKEQKKFYNDMKKLYEIPKSKNETEKINSIEEALLNGGDLSKIL